MPDISRDARVFASKTARSISEIQQSVNNMADVLVFLEVLGYDDRTAKKNGFENLQELAKYVYNFVDAYDGDRADVPGLSPALGVAWQSAWGTGIQRESASR